MEKLIRLIVKLVICIGISIFAYRKMPDVFQRMFEKNAENGAVYGTFIGVMACLILFGLLYTSITIFWFCFTNEHFVLIVSGFPVPFLLKIVAGFAGSLGYAFLLSWLDKLTGGAGWFQAVEVIVLLPLFLWIDIISAVIALKNGE